MFSWFMKKTPHKSGETICVCLITSYAVSAAIVRTFNNEEATKPVVLFSCEEVISHQHGNNPVVLEKLVIEALKKCLLQCRNHEGNPQKIVLSISEPWISLSYRNASLSKSKPFTVTKKILENIFTKEKKLFEQSLFKNESLHELGIIDIPHSRFTLNGYPLLNPLRQIVKTLSVQNVFAYGPATSIEKFIEQAVSVFHQDIVITSAFESSLEIATNQAKLIIGGITSLLVFNHQGEYTTISIPYGLNKLEQEIMKGLSLPRKLINSTMNFSSQEKKSHDLENSILKSILHLEKHAGARPHAIEMISYHDWVADFIPLFEKKLGVICDFKKSTDLQHIYSHHARVKNQLLDLAIEHALKK